MSPAYFHRQMTYAEAIDYITGLQRRYRNGWEQTRLSVDIAARCAGNEDGVPITFPWDDDFEAKEKTKAVSSEDLRAMKEEARELERLINGK